MPVSPCVARSSPFVAPAEPTASAAVSEPSGFIASLPPAPRPVLRVGDYEVGETACPRLCGHPDIRY